MLTPAPSSGDSRLRYLNCMTLPPSLISCLRRIRPPITRGSAAFDDLVRLKRRRRPSLSLSVHATSGHDCAGGQESLGGGRGSGGDGAPRERKRFRLVYVYNEGSSSAVRKNIKMSTLM